MKTVSLLEKDYPCDFGFIAPEATLCWKAGKVKSGCCWAGRVRIPSVLNGTSGVQARMVSVPGEA